MTDEDPGPNYGGGVSVMRMTVALACVALGLPATALGHRAEVVGALVETHGHRSDGSPTASSFAVRTAGGLIRLSDPQPDALIGQRVVGTDDSSAPGVQGEVRAAGEQRLAAAVASGPRSLLVILLTTPDKPAAAATPAIARSAIFTDGASANLLYWQQSSGATQFVGRVRNDGDIAGPLAIGVSTTGCAGYALADAADASARAAGWAVDAYDHVLYVLPTTSECDSVGWAQIGGRRLWSNGGPTSRIIAHELGHNLGAHHASSLRCSTAAGAPVMLSPSCVASDYGDPFDVMGWSSHLMSSWHRAQLGQLAAARQLALRATQTVTLVSSDDFASAGPRLLLVPRKQPRTTVSSWIALELRSSQGPFDLWATLAPVTTGLSVRVVPAMTVATQSQLLDARPATTTFDDAPLQVGDTFSDAANGIAIRLNSISGPAANVTVTMPTLVDDIAPSTPLGLVAGGNTNAVALRWSPAVDDEAVAHYDIERDGVLVGTTPGLEFSDTRVAELTATTYRVTAVDTSANRGAPATKSVVLADATPPGAVGGLTLRADGADVTLSWAAAADNRAIAGYRLSRGGAALAQVAGLGYRESAPVGEQRYAVRAVDTAGNVGPASEAVVTIAPPPPPPPVTAPPPSSPPPPSRPLPLEPTGWPAGLVAVSPAAVPPTSAPSGAVVIRPRIVQLRRRRTGAVVTMLFAARGASSMRAYRGERRVAKAPGSLLTVRLRVPRGGRRPFVRIVAKSATASSTRTYVLR